jgi:hypothetical protein
MAGLSSMTLGNVDVTDPKVQMVVDQLNKNPNLLPQSGLTWQDLIALNNQIQRLRQQKMVPPNTTVMEDLAHQYAGIAGQPISPEMYGDETFSAANGGIVALSEGGTGNQEEGTEKSKSRFARAREAANPKHLNPRLFPGGLGGLKSFAGKVMPYATPVGIYMGAADALHTAGDLFGADTDAIRRYYGADTSDPSLLGDMGYRLRAGIQDIIPFAGGPLKAMREQGIPAVAPAKKEDKVSPGSGIAPARPDIGGPRNRPAAPVAPAAPGTMASGEPAGVGYETLSPGDLAMAEAKRKREAFVEEMRPQDRNEYISAIEEDYKKAGIGEAAKKREKQLEEREGRMKEGQDRNFWLNAAASFFDMAAEASKSGQAGGALQSLFRSAAKGGQSFAERVRATRDKYEEAYAKLEDAKTLVAENNEKVRMGVIDKGDADFRAARSLYQKAQDDVIKAEDAAANLLKTKEIQQNLEVFRQHAADKRAKEENIARLEAARIGAGGRTDIATRYLQEIDAARGDEKVIKAIRAKYKNMVGDIYPQRTDKPEGTLDKLVLQSVQGQSGKEDGWAIRPVGAK